MRGKLSICVAAMAYAACLQADDGAQWPARQMIEVSGRSLWETQIDLQPSSPVLITVREQGANVTLSARLRQSAVSELMVDSPIDRGGLLAIVVRSAQSARLRLRIAGSEPAGYRGRVYLSIRTLSADDPQQLQAVERAWTSFMEAGRTYAAINELRRRGSHKESSRIGDLQRRASRQYEETVLLAQQTDEARLYAQASFHLAWLAFQDLNEFSSALQRAQAAFEAMRRVGDQYGSIRAVSLGAASLREIANSKRRSTGETALPADVTELFEDSVRRFQSVRQYHARNNQKFEEAQAINNIGLTHHLQGRYDQALEHYADAVKTFGEILDGPNEARSIQNAALVQFELGELKVCASGYARALRVLRQDDDPQLYGDILNNAALCLYVQGEFDRALAYYEKAYRVQEQLQNEIQLARTLHGMGSAYYSMGDRETALGLYSQALARRPAAKDARGRAATLSAMGNIACLSGRMAEAIPYYMEALTLAGSPSARARFRLRLARCLTRAGKLAEAVAYLDEVERYTAGGDDLIASLLLLEHGRLSTARGEWPQARTALEAAFSALAAFELVDEQSDALALMVQGAVAVGDYDGGLEIAERGIRLAEQIRGRSRNPELRATLFAPWRRFYDAKISLLSRQSARSTADPAASQRLEALAMQAAGQSRYRVLDEFLQGSARAESSEMRARRPEREQVLTELSEKRVQLASRQERSGANDDRARRLLRDIAALRARLDVLTAQQSALHGDAASALPDAALDAHVPADTAVISYWIGEQDSIAWVLTSAGLTTYRLADPARIAAAALGVHHALAGPSVPDEQLSRLLRGASDLLLSPLLELNAKRRWIVIADGPLHYVPFGALPAAHSDEPVVARHEIAIAPALRFLTPAGPDRKIESALLVGDPVYGVNDARFSSTSPAPAQSTPGAFRSVNRELMFRRLRGATAEIDEIASHLAGARITRLTGFDAARDAFLNALESRFDLIHVAAHSRIDADFPQLSAIVLSRYSAGGSEQTPWIHAYDLRSRQLRGSLVVLSACESALGRKIGGEGLVGLSYALLAAGARAVAASTWQVPDAATVAYMDAFYESMKIRADVSAAVTHASRTMMKSRRWSHPRYWASFVAYENDL